MTDALHIDLSLWTHDEAMFAARKSRPAIQVIADASEAQARLEALEVFTAMIIRQTYVQGAIAAIEALQHQGAMVEIRGLEPTSLDWANPGLEASE